MRSPPESSNITGVMGAGGEKEEVLGFKLHTFFFFFLAS